MKPNQSPAFSTRQLLEHQEKDRFSTHIYNSTADELKRDQAVYAKKRELLDLLWQAVEDGVGEVTIRTQTTEVKMLVGGSGTLYAIVEALSEELGPQLSDLERGILHNIARLEEGDNAGGLEVSPESWAAKDLIAKEFDATGISRSPHDERTPLAATPLKSANSLRQKTAQVALV